MEMSSSGSASDSRKLHPLGPAFGPRIDESGWSFDSPRHWRPVAEISEMREPSAGAAGAEDEDAAEVGAADAATTGPECCFTSADSWGGEAPRSWRQSVHSHSHLGNLLAALDELERRHRGDLVPLRELLDLVDVDFLHQGGLLRPTRNWTWGYWPASLESTGEMAWQGPHHTWVRNEAGGSYCMEVWG